MKLQMAADERRKMKKETKRKINDRGRWRKETRVNKGSNDGDEGTEEVVMLIKVMMREMKR